MHAGVLPDGIRPSPVQYRRRHDSLPRPVATPRMLAVPPPPAVRTMRCGQIAQRCRNRCPHPDTRQCHYATKHTNAPLGTAPAPAAAARHALRGANADAAGRRRARTPSESVGSAVACPPQDCATPDRPPPVRQQPARSPQPARRPLPDAPLGLRIRRRIAPTPPGHGASWA